MEAITWSSWCWKLLARCCVWARAAPVVPVTPSKTVWPRSISRGMKISFLLASSHLQGEFFQFIEINLVISSSAAFARSVFLPRWWPSSLGDYRSRQGLSSFPSPSPPLLARSRTASLRLSSVDRSRTVAPPSASFRSGSPPSPPTVDRSRQQRFSADFKVAQAPGLPASVS